MVTIVARSLSPRQQLAVWIDLRAAFVDFTTGFHWIGFVGKILTGNHGIYHEI
jgi:hypothetical protein